VGEWRSSPGSVGVKRYFDRVKLPRPNERSGPLVGHVKKGRTYRSALAATGVLQIGDWVRDDLPDLLWPVLTLSEFGTAEAVRFVRWQKAVQEDLSGKAEPRFIAECLDGRLTSLDRLAAQVPEARAVVKARAEERGLLPKSVVNALASYPLRPAEWLVDREMTPPDQEEIDLLARAVLGVLKDGHRKAVIKCLHIWSAVQAGTFSTSAETIELLQRYPTDPRTRAKADSAVRAIWGARKGLLLHENESHFADAIKWAKVFWGTNSMTTRCMRRREVEADDHDPKEGAVETPSDATSRGEAAAPGALPEPALRAHLAEAFSTRRSAAWSPPTRPDAGNKAARSTHGGRLYAPVSRPRCGAGPSQRDQSARTSSTPAPKRSIASARRFSSRRQSDTGRLSIAIWSGTSRGTKDLVIFFNSPLRRDPGSGARPARRCRPRYRTLVRPVTCCHSTTASISDHGTVAVCVRGHGGTAPSVTPVISTRSATRRLRAVTSRTARYPPPRRMPATPINGSSPTRRMPTARNTALAGISSRSRRTRPNRTSYAGSAGYGVLDMNRKSDRDPASATNASRPGQLPVRRDHMY
jgi:hypothetical protein